MEYKVKFMNQSREISVTGGTLAEACQAAGFPLNLICGGKGTCGKCAVTVERNGQKEKVLACKTMVEQDEMVYLTEEDYVHNGNVLTDSRLADVAKNPSIKKVYYTKEELTPEHCGSFFTGVAIPVMRKFAAMSSDFSFVGATFVYFDDKILDIQNGDTTKECYGAAIDIGTTTVAAYFYDLLTGSLISVKSALNKQIVHGADVITRNVFSQEKEENLIEMRSLIQETINNMFQEAESEREGLLANLYHVVLCGNSTMQHLFFGFNPANLGISPFVNITAESVRSNGKEAGLDCAEEAMIEFLPLLGGFVGADTTAVLTNLQKEDAKYLMVDLGTNGEIAVGNKTKYLVSSTACGPALEGGNIACGMRGTDGAIEKISLENDQVKIQVIGNQEAKGLCGSAIIDAVSELRRVGMIDDGGGLITREDYEKVHPGSELAKHLGEVEEFNTAFYFTEGENPVYICQQDVRQIQLAKSSIYSGCMILLSEYGLTPNDVDALILSGAFGNYIDIDNALSIGLLPAVPRERIMSIGNGAGQGVQTLLLDSSYREKINNIPETTTHVELADHPSFMEEYIMNMNFYN
ncbi:MAG: ASKHA domain-containing protein [Lachnospiraceae bacterium]|nr:ASKHA domain-containing protein [Lachnospiraceae bacterium]